MMPDDAGCMMHGAGFQEHVRRPYLMITALRNPLEVFVSGKQYTHKGRTRTLDQVRLKTHTKGVSIPGLIPVSWWYGTNR